MPTIKGDSHFSETKNLIENLYFRQGKEKEEEEEEEEEKERH